MAKTSGTQRDEFEYWEAVGAGTVWVTMTDVRGRETQHAIGGPKGAKRLRLKTEDREAMQHLSENNPFENGRLRRVGPGAPEAQVAKTDEQLLATLASSSLEEDLLSASEFEVRRLKELASADAATSVSVAQLHTLNKVIEQRWPQAAPPSDQLPAAMGI